MNLDKTDYSILQLLYEADKPLWKKQLHTWLEDQAETLPGQDSVSIQTISRRIDTLHDEAYIASCIINPENLNRELIIAYKITEDGVTTMREIRKEILQDYAADALRDTDSLPQDTVAALLIAELDPDAETAAAIKDANAAELAATVITLCTRELLGTDDTSALLKTLRSTLPDPADDAGLKTVNSA